MLVDGEQVEVHHPRPLGRGFLARRHRGAAADVADENVDRAPLLLDLMRQRQRRGGVGDVGGMERGAAADLLAGRLEPVEAARRKRHLGAFGGERACNRKADAAAGADDECGPIRQVRVSSPCVLEPANGHVAILRQRAGVVAVGGACGLENVLSAIAGLLDQPDRLAKIGRAACRAARWCRRAGDPSRAH